MTWLDHLSAVRNYNRLVTKSDRVRLRRRQARRAEAKTWARAAAENVRLRQQLENLESPPSKASTGDRDPGRPS